jgi:hypothetical protein
LELLRLLEHATSSTTAGTSDQGAEPKPRSKCRAERFAEVAIAVFVRM